MSAKASGTDAKPNANGNTTNRTHHDGSADRAFTVEQKEAVLRVRKCGPTAFYDILGLESERSTVTDGGIKKAYRKLSLLTHPDKNGYAGADEAFKMVSRAFQILSDPEKKKRYDQFGGDPDNRFSGASASSPFGNGTPFSGFARNAGRPGARGPMFEEEISPEELFRQFFGGGGFGGGFGGGPFGGGLFDAGPAFSFGGPGVRIHQFGGTRPRARPPGTGGAAPQAPPSAFAALQNLLPLLLLILLPILTSLFSGGDNNSASSWGTSNVRVPPFSLDNPAPPLTSHRVSAKLHVDYYVDPADVAAYEGAGGRRKWADLDRAAEGRLVQMLGRECAWEQRKQQQLYNDAHGWFLVDNNKIAEARAMPMPGCKRMDALRIRRPAI